MNARYEMTPKQRTAFRAGKVIGRDEALRKFESYPGELVALRGLLGQIRVTAKHGTLDDLRTALAEHDDDEQTARRMADAGPDNTTPNAPGPGTCDCMEPAPHPKLPCRHCAMDLCEDCKTCATCPHTCGGDA